MIIYFIQKQNLDFITTDILKQSNPKIKSKNLLDWLKNNFFTTKTEQIFYPTQCLFLLFDKSFRYISVLMNIPGHTIEKLFSMLTAKY